MKKVILWIMLGLMILMTAGCAGSAFSSENAGGPTPEIAVTVNGETIQHVVGLNMWDGAVCDREDTFHTIMKEGSGYKIPYVKIGDEIKIEFKGVIPEKFKLYDVLLTKDGKRKYSEKEVFEISAKVQGRELAYKLPSNMAVFLSSHSDDYKSGNTIRGFRLICAWGENECEYAYVIRTDAILAGSVTGDGS